MSSASHLQAVSPKNTPDSKQAYRDAGVDFDRAHSVVQWAKAAAARAKTPYSLGGIGGFSGAFKIPPGYPSPILLAACDGVGTKLAIAQLLNQHHTVGIDLVAMNVNDMLTQGARPLSFLDYVAAGKIEQHWMEPVLNSIAEGCVQAGCDLLGGETAEMPGFYEDGKYDLAGFTVGVVDEAKLYPRTESIQPGQVLIGLGSTGVHSNGYSLVRKILLNDAQLDLNQPAAGMDAPLGEVLLRPTQIYVKPVLAALERFGEAISAMVHITGGGFLDNLPRVLPAQVAAQLDWPLISRRWPDIFTLLQQTGKLDAATMAHTFNCGVGYVIAINADQADAFIAAWPSLEGAEGIDAFVMGKLIAHHHADAPQVILEGPVL